MSFSTTLNQIVKKSGKLQTKVAKDIGKQFSEIAHLTPVKSGQARRNWFGSLNRRSRKTFKPMSNARRRMEAAAGRKGLDEVGQYGKAPSKSPSSKLGQRQVLAAVNKMRKGDRLYISNIAPYGGSLIYNQKGKNRSKQLSKAQVNGFKRHIISTVKKKYGLKSL